MSAAPTTGTPTDFNLLGPLPTGTTLLEASAGTGKTYTIAALTARFVAEGVARLDQLMLVTFGRMASNELRDRVHSRLVRLEATLAARLAGRPPEPAPDVIEDQLLAADPAELATRHRRVVDALSDFDSATIATTHEFCLRMLEGLGILGDQEPDAVFVEELTELTREVATDLYLQRYADYANPGLKPADAVALAQRAVAAPHAELAPAVGPDDPSGAAERVRFAEAVRAEVERRKRAARLLTYDDMLTRLRDTLADPVTGELAAARLRERYPIVLIDEFQDTDPIQWEIIERAFVGHVRLVMIGDPKQAIYAFRGAEVYSYLDAVRRADRVLTLGDNRRSDQALVDALESLMGGATLGEEQIVVRPVRAAEQGRRLSDPRALRLRYLPHESGDERGRTIGTLRRQLTDDLVADIIDTLDGGATLDLGSGRRRLRPADIAVLVRTNGRGEAIRDALVAAGVPAVMHGATSVFGSPMAQDWLTLLTALDQPRAAQVRKAALTCFFGWTIEQLATATEDDLLPLTTAIRAWQRLLAQRGVAALLEAATVEQHVPERLLQRSDGARDVTDLRHLAQSMHAAMCGRHLGSAALAEWLREQIADARRAASIDLSRRLETDAAAVSVLTVHRSKGLQFPIVYLPDLGDRFVGSRDQGRELRLHEPGPDGRLRSVLDVGGPRGDGRSERFARQQREDSGEDLRLAYVALTRAQCQVVTWWAPSKSNTPASALQRFLFRTLGEPVAAGYRLSSGDPSHARPLGRWVSLEEVVPRAPTAWSAAPASASGLLRARHFARTLDLDWRRTSYSSLTASAHGTLRVEPGVSSESPVAKEDDEELGLGTAGAPSLASSVAGWDQVSPMAELPSGAAFGTVVHAVYEALDPAADDLRAELGRACAAALASSPIDRVTPESLADAMLPTVLTPLGPLAADRRLADFGRRDVIAEAGFELPLAGGDRPTSDVRLGDVAGLLRRHLTPDDPLAGYADLLDPEALAGQALRGYLNGSIDAVLRVRATETGREPHYLVVDYKTNWLGPPEAAPLTLAAYTPEPMAAAMMSAHYPLQALLYSVALHRMLRWRQPGYRPETHLGGILYLFVRGMAGPDTPRVDGVPCGVFSWHPPAALVVELSDLLAGGAR